MNLWDRYTLIAYIEHKVSDPCSHVIFIIGKHLSGGVIMSNKWTTKMYVAYVNENHPDFEVRGEYENNNTNVLMFHKKCGREFSARPGNFKTRGTCSLCNGFFKKSTKQFKEEVSLLVSDEYRVLGDYVNARTEIKMRHNVCLYEYYVTPDHFLNAGTRCPNCFGNARKSTEQFATEVADIFENEYIVLGEYSNNKVPLLMQHNSEKCQHKFMVSPDAFLRGSHCNKCGLKKRSGKLHYKFNPNLTDEERQARDMQNGEIRKWREKVYKRDDYTCQICHEKGGKLNAHHIYSWDKYEDKRFDVKNGVTLCESCHKKFHISYGYGGNTAADFKHHLVNLKTTSN